MKKNYQNPEAMITLIADEDILTISIVSSNGGVAPNGYDDSASIGDMF